MISRRCFPTSRAWIMLSGLLLGACAQLVQTQGPSIAADPEAMKDLTGAACTIAGRTDIAADPGAPAPVQLYCGKGRPSGAVTAMILPLRVPEDEAERHAVFEKVAATSAAGRDAALRMGCRDGKWLRTKDELDLLIKPCSLLEGGWPQVLVIGQVGKYLLQADGLPAMMPALETAMVERSGYQPPEGVPAFGGREAVRELLETALGRDLRMIGAADFVRFGELTEAARLASSRKDFKAAEDAYREALLIQERAFGPDSPVIGFTLMSLALEVSNQGRFDESATLFRRADPIIQRSANPTDRARFFTYMAYDAANAGRFADALPYAREATGIWRDLAGDDAGPNLNDLTGGDEARSALRGELAHALNLEAAMAVRVGQLADAEAAAKEGLAIIGEERGLPPWWRPEMIATMAEIYAEQGRLNDAEQSFRGALIFQQRLFGDTAPTASLLLQLGRIYTRQELYAEAIRSYTFALKILAGDDIGRSQLVFDQLAPLLTSATALARQQPDQRSTLQAMMFRAVQLMRASVADQTIGRASARLAAGDPQMAQLVRAMQEAERGRDAARIELAHQTSLPDEERGSVIEARLLAEINRQNSLHDALLQQIQQQFPAYAGFSNPGPVELADLQSKLRDGEAMLMFEIGARESYVLLISHGRFVARPLDVDQARLDQAVRDIRSAFVLRAGGVGDFDLNDAHDLYRTLFQPIAGDLAGIEHLIVVPNGALASLPLSLLVTERPTAAAAHDYRRAAWLARQFSTSYVASPRAFLALRAASASAAHAPKPFFGVGNPAFSGRSPERGERNAPPSGLSLLAGQCRDGGPVPPQLLRALAPLPETASELRAVAQILGAGGDATLTGTAANEAALRRLTLADYRVLYFATHGLLPGELSCQSEPALALSPPAQTAASREEDGLLDASEIAGLQLNADIVVLSACNTAQSAKQFGGEALSGLAESFFYAGARSLIASHWEVPSVPTVSLMTGLFQRLGPDLAATGAAEAIRQAQLALIEAPATAHPFFWAAFTLIGDGARRPVPGATASR